MMHGKHIIPRSDEEAVRWGDNFVKKIEQKAAGYLVENAELDELKASFQNFKNLVAKTKSPESNHVDIVNKNEARKDFEQKTRSIVNYQLSNPNVTDDDRASLGLPIHDHTRTAIGPIGTYPIVTAEAHSSRHLRLDFRDTHTAGKARPYGVNGAVVACEVLDHSPETPDDLPQIALASRTPYILEFSETQRGQTAYIALCWENERGQRGPWSDIVSQIIP